MNQLKVLRKGRNEEWQWCYEKESFRHEVISVFLRWTSGHIVVVDDVGEAGRGELAALLSFSPFRASLHKTHWYKPLLWPFFFVSNNSNAGVVDGETDGDPEADVVKTGLQKFKSSGYVNDMIQFTIYRTGYFN